MPLTDAGLTVLSGSEYLDAMIDEYETLTGLTVDRTRTHDSAVMVMTTITATQLGEASELLLAVFNALNPDGATGKIHEDGSALVGVDPDPATYSSVTVTLTATAGTQIPAGSIIEDSTTLARWVTSEDVTSTGSDDVVALAMEAGPVLASAAAIDTIVTPVPGWSAVTNAAAASPGESRESDASLRQRRRRALASSGSASVSSIRSALLDKDYLDGVLVLENTDSVAAVVNTKVLDRNSIWVFISPETLTDAQEDEVAEILHRKAPAGVNMMSDAATTKVTKQVTDVGGITSHQVEWNYAASVDTTITATVTLEPGFELTDVSGAIGIAVEGLFETLGLGDILRAYDLTVATAGIDGLASVSWAASAGALDYDPGPTGQMNLTSTTVTL